MFVCLPAKYSVHVACGPGLVLSGSVAIRYVLTVLWKTSFLVMGLVVVWHYCDNFAALLCTGSTAAVCIVFCSKERWVPRLDKSFVQRVPEIECAMHHCLVLRCFEILLLVNKGPFYSETSTVASGIAVIHNKCHLFWLEGWRPTKSSFMNFIIIIVSLELFMQIFMICGRFNAAFMNVCSHMPVPPHGGHGGLKLREILYSLNTAHPKHIYLWSRSVGRLSKCA